MDPAGFEPAAASLQRRNSTETELRGPRAVAGRQGQTTATASVPGESRTLSLARAKGTFFLLELRALVFDRFTHPPAIFWLLDGSMVESLCGADDDLPNREMPTTWDQRPRRAGSDSNRR